MFVSDSDRVLAERLPKKPARLLYATEEFDKLPLDSWLNMESYVER